MLEYLRNAADKPVAKLLMGLLIFSFVGWGVASWIFGESRIDDSILKVGDEKLSYEKFENERSRLIAGMSREEQKRIYSDPALQQNFSASILSSMTSRLLLEARAKDLGFYVSNAQIAGIIRNTSEFKSGGSFSPEMFDMILSRIGWTESQYANVLREEILRNMAITATTLLSPVPDFAVQAAFNARYAMRKIEYTSVKYSDFKVSGTPDDSKLAEIYSRNPKIIPEFRNVNYVLIPVKDMTAPDLYDAGYIAAQKLEDMLIGGDTMEAAAKSAKARFVSLPAFNAEKKNATGKTVADEILTDEVLVKSFTMDSGIESEIIETPRGFVIMRVEKINAAHAAPMDSVRNDLMQQWKTDEQLKQAYVRSNEILTDLNAGKKAALQSANVTRMDGAPTDVLVAAFNNPVGTKTIVPGKNEFYVLSVVSESMPKPDQKKLNATRTEVENTMSRSITDDYTNFLTNEYPVKVNKKIYNRLFGN